MRLLQGLRNDANSFDDAVLDAAAIQLGRRQLPWRPLDRNPPISALDRQHVFRPAFLDDPEVLFEGSAVRRVDVVMLVRRRAVDAMGLLRHGIDPAALIAAGKARICAPAGHVVQHGDILRHADRVLCRQDYTELPDANAPGLHRDVEVEHHGIVRELHALDLKMMLGEADRIIAEVVGEARLSAQLGQHPGV